MLFSQNNDVGAESPQKLISDKQTAAQEIEDIMAETEATLLEAVTWWLEERSIPESQFARYVPEAIIERLKDEVIDDGILKPSITKLNKRNSLDFLYG